MKLLNKTLLSVLLIACIIFGAAGCSSDDGYKALEDELAALTEKIALLEEELKPAAENASPLAHDYGEECYEKLKYIDEVIRDRDCVNGEAFKLAQKWIQWNLLKAGYDKGDIALQDVTFSRYCKKDTPPVAANSYTTDGKFYIRSGRKYVEDENGDYIKADIVSKNIVVTKHGKSDKQIIVGAHYDGTGTGDNGSGVALALTTAEHLAKIETEFTIVFVFFTAEEIGLYGSNAYAAAMTEEEKNNTLYMINIDSVVCGDYCYLYGGVQNNDAKIVTKTEAFDNAWAIAEELGLDFKKNPWTWDNLAPENGDPENPDYASPSTGNWSDHAGFKKAGITYLYMEATNWEIPDYTGYGETYLIGMLMNTENDYLEYIEHYFPGRPLEHLTKFSALLNKLVTQTEWNY